jgi:predicted RNA binding protein YcfA (HicA-like mRNA interferase family)
VPAFGPTKRAVLIASLRQLGFEGPISGAKHQFMVRGGRTVRIPNPHQSDIGIGLLGRVLKQAGIEREEWENL